MLSSLSTKQCVEPNICLWIEFKVNNAVFEQHCMARMVLRYWNIKSACLCEIIFWSSFTGNLRIMNINIAVFYWNALIKVILGWIN